MKPDVPASNCYREWHRSGVRSGITNCTKVHHYKQSLPGRTFIGNHRIPSWNNLRAGLGGCNGHFSPVIIFYLLLNPGMMILPVCFVLGRVNLRNNSRAVVYFCLFVTCLVNSERLLLARTLRSQSRHFSERDGSITNRNKAIAVR